MPRKKTPTVRAVAWGKALSTREGDFVHPYDRIGENHVDRAVVIENHRGKLKNADCVFSINFNLEDCV